MATGWLPPVRAMPPALRGRPNIDRLISLPGATRIDASGARWGCPPDILGNSEVGHLNIGAGRIVYDMTRHRRGDGDGELASNAALLELLANVKRTGGRLHFAGLLSDGGVHQHINHLGALMDIAAAHGVDVRVHAFMDGRDTSPTSGAGFLAQLGDMMARTRRRIPACRWNRLLSWGVFTLWTATSAGSG